MPDRRRHRGAHPGDARLFAEERLPDLRQAVSDYSWLLGRGYAQRSALKLVGDRYRLRERQRVAVMRCGCADVARVERARRALEPGGVEARPLLVDGYNVLTTVEAALSGGPLLVGLDGCLRDMASMHGHFHRVDETREAIARIGRVLERLRPSDIRWYLDAPVSNSGRLRALMSEVARGAGWSWSIDLVVNPDRVLIDAADPVATADSAILDAGGPWFNLARHVVESVVEDPWLVDLGTPDPGR